MLRLLYKTIATGFGSGYAPIAPGTMGAIVGCLLFWLSVNQSIGVDFFTFQSGFLIIIILTTIIGAYVTKQLESEWGEDPSKVVIDEIVGVWIALLWLPFSWQYTLAGFVLFRFFDIVKPLGIKRLEQVPNGWGVMLDDVLAGIYANVCLQVAKSLLGICF